MPRAFDPAQGKETLRALPALASELSELVVAVSGCSPFLKTLLEQEREGLLPFFEHPEASFEAVLNDLCDPQDPQMPQRLRRAKARVALMTALADLAGIWSLEEVTARLSRFADAATACAMQAALAVEIRRRKLP
ncbi:MAG: glutamine-synthetase adenylyltransferase, partial [Pseudomonadota bacterium]